MRKASIFCAVLLLSTTALQMDSANASPFTRRTNRVRVQTLSASSLIDTATEFVEVRAFTQFMRMRVYNVLFAERAE